MTRRCSAHLLELLDLGLDLRVQLVEPLGVALVLQVLLLHVELAQASQQLCPVERGGGADKCEQISERPTATRAEELRS